MPLVFKAKELKLFNNNIIEKPSIIVVNSILSLDFIVFKYFININISEIKYITVANILIEDDKSVVFKFKAVINVEIANNISSDNNDLYNPVPKKPMDRKVKTRNIITETLKTNFEEVL